VLNNMKYRSRFTIASSVLRAAQNGGSTKTRLMYGAFLSFGQINEYLTFLLSNQLIMKDEVARTYSPTERGLHFLRMFDEMEKLISLDEPIVAQVAK
jgi:predicted transcriptional regulator